MSIQGEFIDKKTGEVRESNGRFTQVMDDSISEIRSVLREYPKALEMFLFLTEHMDNHNALVISQKALSEALECSLRSVTNYTKYLIDKEFIKILKTGNSNVYHLNERIVWKNSAEKRKYATFSAKVYVSHSEQEVTVKKKNIRHIDTKK